MPTTPHPKCKTFVGDPRISLHVLWNKTNGFCSSKPALPPSLVKYFGQCFKQLCVCLECKILKEKFLDFRIKPKTTISEREASIMTGTWLGLSPVGNLDTKWIEMVPGKLGIHNQNNQYSHRACRRANSVILPRGGWCLQTEHSTFVQVQGFPLPTTIISIPFPTLHWCSEENRADILSGEQRVAVIMFWWFGATVVAHWWRGLCGSLKKKHFSVYDSTRSSLWSY